MTAPNSDGNPVTYPDMFANMAGFSGTRNELSITPPDRKTDFHLSIQKGADFDEKLKLL
jgi:hypothetical protein